MATIRCNREPSGSSSELDISDISVTKQPPNASQVDLYQATCYLLAVSDSTHKHRLEAHDAAGRNTHPALALIVIAAAQLMVVLDGSIVNIALPSIQTDLGVSASSLAWVVNAYALAFGGLLLLGGKS